MRRILLLALTCAACWRASVPSEWSRPAVVFLGDSLTDGQGVGRDDTYPALLERKMKEAGIDLVVVNAGISGDSTENGLARLERIAQYPIAVLFVALGANDALVHHRKPEEIRSNLVRIIERGRSAGAQVVLAGMKIPLWFPEDYRQGFADVFPDLARQYDIPLVPFLLEGVGGNPAFNLPDGLHPNADGYRRVADVVWPVLEPVLRRASPRTRETARP